MIYIYIYTCQFPKHFIFPSVTIIHHSPDSVKGYKTRPVANRELDNTNLRSCVKRPVATLSYEKNTAN